MDFYKNWSHLTFELRFDSKSQVCAHYYLKVFICKSSVESFYPVVQYSLFNDKPSRAMGPLSGVLFCAKFIAVPFKRHCQMCTQYNRDKVFLESQKNSNSLVHLVHTSSNSFNKWTKISSLEIIIFELKNDGKKWSRIYFEIHQAPLEIPAKLPG